ncbi:MAG: DUF4421 family protein [Marinilabiliaceae bacterium]|nr:DUF4421 family protein [Marinilabiliaceae bacterium]
MAPMRPFIFITLTSLLCGTALAQTAQRIINYPRYIHTYARLGPSFMQFEVDHSDLSNDIEYRPNVSAEWNLGFYYSWFGLDVSFASSKKEMEQSDMPATKRFDLEAHYTLRRIMMDFTIKQYQGFYISNPQLFDPDRPVDAPLPFLPDLQTRTLSGNITYVLKPEKFSPNAAYHYTQAMRHPGGSWLLGAFISHSSISGDSTIVPQSLRDATQTRNNLSAISFTDIGISCGYAYLHTFYRKWFVTATFQPGLSYQQTLRQAVANGESSRDSGISLRSVIRLALGFNGDRIYGGIGTYQETAIVRAQQSRLSLNSGHLNVFLGYRINTDNWGFMKHVDRVLHPKSLRFLTGNPPQRN